MPPPDARVEAFLRACPRALGRPLSTAEHLALVRLAATLPWEAFVHGAAGVLGQSPEGWADVAGLGRAAEAQVAPSAAVPSPSSARRRLALVVVTLLALMAVGVYQAGLRPIDFPTLPALPSNSPAPPPPPVQWAADIEQPARVVDRTTQPPPRPFAPADAWPIAGLAAAGLGLALLGLALTAGFAATRRRRAQEQAAQAAREGVDRWDPPPAPASAFPVVNDATLLASATLLGGLTAPHPGEELDGDATAAATAAAGGRFTPRYVPRRPQASVTILLDVEDGGHLWLPAFHRLLADWTARGVRLRVFTFGQSPHTVRPLAGGRALALDRLAARVARAPGEHPRPLLILSRLLTDRGPGAERHAWPRALRAWPRRAWIDPTPGPLDGRRQALAERAGLAVFALTASGVLAVARHLAGQDAPAAPRPALPPDDERALTRWAQAAACVPDATWDQIERIRQRLPAIRDAYPERWHCAALVAWVEGQDGTPDAGNGDRLLPRRPLVHGWLRDLERDDPELARAVRQMLIEELRHRLGALRDQGRGQTLAAHRARVSLQRQQLHLALEPAVVAELELALSGPAGAEARMALDELQQTRRLDRATPAERAGAQALRTVGGWRRVVAPGRALLAGLLVAALAGGIGWAFREPLTAAGRVLPRKGVQITEPAIVRVRKPGEGPDVLPATEFRPQMQPIPAGSFLMGSPADEAGRGRDEDSHLVDLSRGFWLGATEVTQGQWAALMEARPSYFQGDRTGGDGYPVDSVDWFDVVSYLNRLSQREGLSLCYELSGCVRGGGGEMSPDCEVTQRPLCAGYRLPTEAEWEYAARAGTALPVPSGGWRILGTFNAPVLDPIAWYGGNSGTTRGYDCSVLRGRQYPRQKQCGSQRVAGKAPNAWGLYDMIGNLWEWTDDYYHGYPVSEVTQDPGGPPTGSNRAIRGCGWISEAKHCRPAERSFSEPGARNNYVGFRPARTQLFRFDLAPSTRGP